MNFRAFRDRIMTYHDDFIRANTLDRVEKTGRAMQPYFEAARGDDIYILRAIAHYRGQCSLRERLSLVTLEAASCALLLALPVLFLWTAFKGRIKISGAKAYYILLAPVNERVAALYKIPDELAATQTPKTFIPRQWRLTASDWHIIKRLCALLLHTRTPYPVQFIFKAIKDMALIRGYLDTYPDAAYGLIAGEYSCTLALHTLQHKRAGKALYNVMHGDNASTPMESFFKVDRFYAWDAHYITLFHDQRIDADFRISPNPDFVLKPDEKLSDTGIGVVIPMMNFLPEAYANTDALLRALGAVLKNTENLNLRPHPAYPHTYAILSACIQAPHTQSDPRGQSPHDFILANRVIIGFYSTVLVEAAHMGARVIIIQSAGSLARSGYHGLFAMPNVRHVPLADLPAAIEAFIDTKTKGEQYVA